MVTLGGHADEGFGRVADTLASSFERGNQLGAAFSLYVGGVPRVDLWGGIADARTGRQWTEDTLQIIFSATKGATAICVARLVERGALSYDDAVARHWPEFAANGKGEITVGQLLSHQAGLIAVDAPLTFDEIMAVTPVVESLQQQVPSWEPGTAHGYHGFTYGWLAGELVRRIDGRRIAQFFQDEVVEPLGLEFWIGLPEAEERRVARIEAAPRPPDAEVSMATNAFRSLTLDGRISAAGENHFNSRALHATEMPAGNGITTARSLARMYAATFGSVDGVRLLAPDTMEAARAERAAGPDLTLGFTTRFGAGFWLHGDAAPMIQPGSFGHPGGGGPLGYANPELNIGYGYVMNQGSTSIVGDPRTVALNDAVIACL